MSNYTHRQLSSAVAVTCAAVALGLPLAASEAAKPSPPVAHANGTVFAAGLNTPPALEFGPDGTLYVAEGGVGGANPPPADPDCVVVPPVGPYSGSATGSRISRIDGDGNRTTFVDGLPSSQTSAALGNLVSGVADVAFIGTR